MKGAAAIASPERIALGAWKRAVGKRLAVRTKALKLVRDRLVIEVEDEVWRESLWKLRFQILRNIEKEIGPEIVADLSFVVPPALVNPHDVDESDAIADPGLRRVYRNSRRRLSA